jgi:hypothetical protein
LFGERAFLRKAMGGLGSVDIKLSRPFVDEVWKNKYLPCNGRDVNLPLFNEKPKGGLVAKTTHEGTNDCARF